MENADNGKWNWIMNYCKRKGIPPAEAWAWEEGEQAFNNRFK